MAGMQETITQPGAGVIPSGEVHPAADVFPMLTASELEDLAEDIRANGLIHPIILDAEGRLIDGRNRYAACQLAEVAPRFEVLAEDVDPVAYILSMNIARRHLSKGQQAMAVAKVRLVSDRSTREVAEDVGVSKARVVQASVVLQHAPDLVPAVLAGATSLDAAYAKAREVKQMADSEQSQLATLRAHAPDLADMVADGMAIAEATAAYRARVEDRDGQVRRAVARLRQVLVGWSEVETFERNPHSALILEALEEAERAEVRHLVSLQQRGQS